MPWTQVCYQYDGSYSGFLSCVFDSYVNQEEPAEFRTPEDMCCSLYPLRTVETNVEHAKRVYRSFEKLGREGRELAVRAYLTCLPERELWLWRFLRLGYAQGRKIGQNLTDPVVDKVRKAVWHLEHEAHQYKGFTRFSDLSGVLAGEIEPKNRVLPLLCPHFCSRYPQENFVNHDRTHCEALFHRPGPNGWAILPVADFQLGPADGTELSWRRLWRSFYDTIAIEGRTNPKCRMTHMPKRYWAMMTEFQEDYGAALPEVHALPFASKQSIIPPTQT